MVRAIITFVLAVAIGIMTIWLGSVAVQPVGEHIKDNYDTSDVNGPSTIDEVYDSVFMWGPVVFVGGMGVWVVRWYFRREAIRGPR